MSLPGWRRLFSRQYIVLQILSIFGISQVIFIISVHYLIGYPTADYHKPPPSSNFSNSASNFVELLTGVSNITTAISRAEEHPVWLRDVLSRVKTQQCKDILIAVSEKELNKTLYADYAYQGTCPNRDVSKSRYVGCFRDNLANPDLNESKPMEFAQNTPLRCVEHCYSLGLDYAAVRRTACNCGGRFGKYGALPVARCSYRCPGNHTIKCGGNAASSVYTTETGMTDKFADIHHLANFTVEQQSLSRSAVIAFVLSLSGRNVRQIGRILRLIYRPEHYYYIHIDARAEYLYREVKTLTNGLENVHVADSPNRFSTIWGGASLLTMILSSYNYLINRHDWNWDYAINLSESDIPIRPVEELGLFLGINSNRIFITSHTDNTDNYLINQGMYFTFVECENRMWRLNTRSLPRGVRIYGASDWLTLPRDFVNFVVEALSMSDPFITNLRHYFGYTLMPVESFFQTVAMNTHFCEKVTNRNLRLINWQRKRGCRCTVMVFVDWCGCSPNDFWAVKTGDFFIARKFEETIDQKIVNLIETDILHTLEGNEVGIDHFWLKEFSSETDSRSSQNFINRQPYYEAFIAMTLKLFKPAAVVTANCPQLEVEELLSVNFLKIKNKFQGLLVEFSTGAYTFEAKAVHSAEYTTNRKKHTDSIDPTKNKELTALFASWGFRVASISMGSDFDVKEGVFRNPGSLLVTQQKEICLFIDWEPVASRQADQIATTAKLHAVFFSPDGNNFWCSFSPQVNKFVTTICECADLLENLLKAGVWEVQVESIDSSHPKVKLGGPVSFVVLDRNLPTQANLELINPDFWSIDDVCVVESDQNDQDDCFSAESLGYFKPCTETSWSSHSPDVKSLPKIQQKRKR